MSYTTPDPKTWATFDVPECVEACANTTDDDGNPTPHVHLPTYARVGRNDDGTIRVRAPADYFKDGKLDTASIKEWYKGAWADQHGAKLDAAAAEVEGGKGGGQ